MTPEPKRGSDPISLSRTSGSFRPPPVSLRDADQEPTIDVIDLPLAQTILYARNPQRNEKAVDTVAASIAEFGWRQPIVIYGTSKTCCMNGVSIAATRRFDNGGTGLVRRT